MVDWKEHVMVDPAVLVGKPAIKGTRITVGLILDRVADGWSTDDIVASYPGVRHEDVQAVVAFAAELLKEETFVAIDKAQA